MTRELFVLLSLVLFVSDDTLTFGTNVNQGFIVVRYILYTIALVVMLCSSKLRETSLEPRSRLVLMLAGCGFVFAMARNLDFRNGYILQAVVMLLAVVLSRYVDRRLFLIAFARYLYWLAVFSLVVFFLTIMARPLVEIFPITVNYGGVEFSNLFFCAVFRDSEVLRNMSIFREPGVFALYLAVGIAIELLYKERICYRHLIVFLAALTTTFSTAGFSIFAVLMMSYLVKSRNVKAIASVASVVVIGLVVLSSAPDLFEQVFSKFNEDSADFASALARLSSISVPSLIFFHNPFFGVGLTNFVEQYLLYSQELFGIPISPEGSSTNTIINTFAIYGAVLGTLLSFGLFRFARFLTISKTTSILLFVALLMVFSSQELRFSLFFNTLIMIGLVRVRPGAIVKDVN